MHFPEKDKIFLQLDEILTSPTKIVVGVSGGPDSRLVFALMNDYYKAKGRDLQLLIVAHYNHGQRKESNKEQQQIFKWYENYHIYYNVDKPKKGLNETTLRLLRHDFFAEVMSKEKCLYLATGHHLDDRIETSFMNILRGTSLQGLGNMTFCDYRKGGFYLRPLINQSKEYIEDLCNKNKILYLLDPTNKDSSLTLRNALRNELLPRFKDLSPTSRRYQSRELIYKQIEASQSPASSDNVRITNGRKHPKWGASYCFEIRLGSPNISRGNTKFVESDRVFVFQKLRISKQISQKNLAERTRFSNTSDDGHKFIAGYYFFKSHGKIYAINGSEKFWEQESDLHIKVTTGENILFDSMKIIIKPERKGATIRYPKLGDSYKGKRVKKRMINQKIPLFRRNFVPVVEKNGKIIDVIKEIIPSFYMKRV